MRITTSSLPNGAIKSAYNSGLAASGGTGPYSWKAVGGTVPPGLELSGSNGMITGMPSATGKFVFTVEVTDSSARAKTALRGLSITVGTAPASLAISNASFPNGELTVAYNSSASATGGTAPYRWSVSSGSLPAGLSLNTSSGAITGTPTTAGANAFSLGVTDSSSTPQTATTAASITVESNVQVTTTSLPAARMKSEYSAGLSAQGGVAPYTWTVSAGSLPSGLSLSTGGTIAGMPGQTGNASFTVQVTDSSNRVLSSTQGLNLNVMSSENQPTPSPLSISTSGVGTGSLSQAYSGSVSASGGTSPYTFSVTAGSLPAGLSLNASSGAISGTPQAAGTFPITLQVKDSSASQQTATGTTSMLIVSSLQITTTGLPSGQVQSNYNAALAAAGGAQPYSWSISSGSLNAGLALSTGGLITGAPTAGGSSSFTVRVTDANSNTATASLSIAVSSSLTITTTSVPGATQGVTYSATLGVSGGTAPYNWSLNSGSLPGGLTLSSSGTISGSATATGTFAIGVQVSDASGNSASQSLNVVVSAPVAGTPAQFAGLKTCVRAMPLSPEVDSGDCNPYASPADPQPNVYNGNAANIYTDPVFGTKIKRLTPQPGMPAGGYAPKYAPHQAWSKNGTYLVLGGPGGGAFLMQGTDPYTYIRQVALPTFDGADEPEFYWSNANDCLMIYVNSNKVQTINVCNGDAVTTIASFTSLTDSQGNVLNLSNGCNGSTCLIKLYIYCHFSADDAKFAAKVVDGGGVVYGFGMFNINIPNGTGSNVWFHKIFAPGDLVENESPANKLPGDVCISEDGNYVSVQWNTFNAGRSTTLANATRTSGIVTVTGTSNYPSGVVVGSTITIDGVQSDPTFNGQFTVTSVSGSTLTYSQSAPDSTISYQTDPNSEVDYKFYGAQVWSASTGAFLGQISRSESHADQLVLSDGTSAFGGGYLTLNSNDYRSWEAYQYTSGTFFMATGPSSLYGPQWHFSGRGSTSPNGLAGYGLVSTYAEDQQVDCSPQTVMCSEIVAVKMDGSNTFYRIAHHQSIQCDPVQGCNYYLEPHATPSRDFTHVIWASGWRAYTNSMDVYLVELP